MRAAGSDGGVAARAGLLGGAGAPVMKRMGAGANRLPAEAFITKEQHAMATQGIRSAERPAPDQELVDIARYALEHQIESAEAYDTARYCLMDTLACGLMALRYPACTKLLGPVVEGADMPDG